MVMAAPSTVVVDLTPLVPGGLNGGAKPLVIGLLKALMRREQRTIFALSCRPEAKQELQNDLASPNVRFADASAVSRRRFSVRRAFRSLAIRAAQRPSTVAFCPFGPPLIDVQGAPVVSILYDLQFLHCPQFFDEAERAERGKNFQAMVSRASAIACISEFTRQQAIEAGAPAERLTTIPIQLPRQASRKAHTPEGEYFLYPANLWKHKNHETLVTAFAMACAQGLPSQVKLVLTGAADATRQQQFEALVAQLDPNRRIEIRGYVSRDELESLLAGALALIYPSLFEGFGIPVIEAMAQGMPVACSNTTALREVAGDAALTFNPGNPQEIADALLRLYREPELRSQLADRGRAHAERYLDHDSMVDAYWQLLCTAASADHP
ncbi:MAG: glycosyltransferase family 4 protein [Cyanobacteria bacterium K_DeepCast_35m_m2_023]|nr:glycosyltransferase family 4 protein [Cyanobacteria bacterium K_DeepCast_35m_m2_023]